MSIKGQRETPVPMECSVRSSLMRVILSELGYKTRTVIVYNATTRPRGLDLDSHTFIEVWNPDTKHWETQDPDYDLYYIEKDTENRVSYAEVAKSPDRYIPCNDNKCGWDIVSRENIKAKTLLDYMDIISIVDKERKARYSFRKDDINPEKTYKTQDGEASFCNILEKNCRSGFYPLSEYTPKQPISH